MKAITFDDFGTADVLQLTDVPDPVLRPDDVLVRNRAVGANRADLSQRRGAYGRADFGDSTLIGLEIAGEVIARGANTGGRGVDVVIGFVGAPYFERNVRALADGGRLVQVGVMGGTVGANMPIDRLLFGHLQIMGTVMKSRTPAVKQAMTRRFAQRWLGRFGPGEIQPVIDTVLPLAQAADAHRRMESGLGVGKIVLSVP